MIGKDRPPDESDEWWENLTPKQRKEALFKRRLLTRHDYDAKRLRQPKDEPEKEEEA